MSEYIENLEKRYATKKFDPSFVLTPEQEGILDQSLNLAPSSYGLQPYKFIKVVDTELRKKLREASWDQPQITDASVLYVLCARKDVNQDLVKDYIQNIVKIRGVDVESLSGYEQMMNGAIQSMSDEQKIEWAKKQVYLALGFLLDAAAQSNLDSCPMEGFDANAFGNILGLDEKDLIATVLCPVGKRSTEDETASYKKVRAGVENIIIKM